MWVWQYLILASLHETDSVVLSGDSGPLMVLKAFLDETENALLSLYCRGRKGRRKERERKGKWKAAEEFRVERKEDSTGNKTRATLPPSVHYLGSGSYHSDQ